MPARVIVILLVIAASLSTAGVTAATAQGSMVQREVQIPVSQPDDQGNPVVLDGRLNLPEGPGPFPAIVFNHGFGGSKGSDGGTMQRLVDAGYIVLRWSQRGFGETGGEVDLMGQKERQDLYEAVTWLNDPDNVPEIWRDHIGQVGASYGGQHAMALTTLNHPAIRAIAPIAGPLDLYRALAPNGVPKITIVDVSWALTLGQQTISEEFHRAVVALTTGVDMAYARNQLQLRSEVNRVGLIRTPLYLANGWNDSYFQAEEWIDLKTQLDRRGVPTWLYLGGIGHPAAEPDTGRPEAVHVISERIIPFFDHFVRGEDNGFEELPEVEVSNTHWSRSTWDGTTMTADGLPFGEAQRWNLCAGLPSGRLQTEPCTGMPVPATLSNTYATTHPGGEYLARYFIEDNLMALPEGRTPTPADTVSFSSTPLAEALQLTGTPTFGVNVIGGSADAPDDGPGPFQSFQLDPIIWDVAPDGSRVLVTRGAYAEDLEDRIGPHVATFDAFGFSHRFEAGHTILVELSTSDMPYLRAASNPFTVVVEGGWLDLPGAERMSAPSAPVPVG